MELLEAFPEVLPEATRSMKGVLSDSGMLRMYCRRLAWRRPRMWSCTCTCTAVRQNDIGCSLFLTTLDSLCKISHFASYALTLESKMCGKALGGGRANLQVVLASGYDATDGAKVLRSQADAAPAGRQRRLGQATAAAPWVILIIAILLIKACTEAHHLRAAGWTEDHVLSSIESKEKV